MCPSKVRGSCSDGRLKDCARANAEVISARPVPAASPVYKTENVVVIVTEEQIAISILRIVERAMISAAAGGNRRHRSSRPRGRVRGRRARSS